VAVLLAFDRPAPAAAHGNAVLVDRTLEVAPR